MTTVTITGFEAEARIMLDKARFSSDWNPTRAVILNVFGAMWSAALPVERIAAIGQAMSWQLADEDQLKANLAKLVREKVLRSYRADGVRHYELNLQGCAGDRVLIAPAG
jgi:hypothetical protein